MQQKNKSDIHFNSTWLQNKAGLENMSWIFFRTSYSNQFLNYMNFFLFMWKKQQLVSDVPVDCRDPHSVTLLLKSYTSATLRWRRSHAPVTPENVEGHWSKTFSHTQGCSPENTKKITLIAWKCLDNRTENNASKECCNIAGNTPQLVMLSVQ